MNFYTWINTVARARGGLAGRIAELKADKKLPKGSTRKSFAKYEDATFNAVWARFEQFVKKGSQAGKRSRATKSAAAGGLPPSAAAPKAVKTKKAA